jgi:hypothetical protein
MKGKIGRALILLFLVLGGVLAGLTSEFVLSAGRAPPDPLSTIFDPDVALSFEGALAIAEALDQIGDSLDGPALPHTEADLANLSLEIIPFFYYDNIVDGEQVNLVWPHWKLFDGDANFHVLGRCRVGDDPLVWLNIRYANPWSSSYGRSHLFATLVHELAHAQGVFLMAHPMSEPATQLVTVEILAAMSRNRNVWAVPAFVREVQRYASDYAHSQALQNGREAEWNAFVGRVADDIYDLAANARAGDHWANDMPELKRILKNYGEQPWILLVEALNNPDYMSRTLYPLPNDKHIMQVNDAAWVLQHLAQMANEYPALLAEFEDQSESRWKEE